MGTSDKRMRCIHHGPPGVPFSLLLPRRPCTTPRRGKDRGAASVLETHKTSDDYVYPEVTLASQLEYFLTRDHAAELARRAERTRQTRIAEAAEAPSRLGRLFSRLNARSEQRELTLTPGGVERSPIAGGCLEVE